MTNSPERWLAQEYSKIGVAQLQRGESEEGIVSLEKGLTLDSANGMLWLNLAKAYGDEKGDDRRARTLYERALSTPLLLPEQERAWMGKGLVEVDLDEYGNALDSFRQVIALNPRHAGAWQFIGNVHYILKKYESAQRAWQRSLDLQPNNPALAENLESLNRSLGQDP